MSEDLSALIRAWKDTRAAVEATQAELRVLRQAEAAIVRRINTHPGVEKVLELLVGTPQEQCNLEKKVTP